VTQQNAAMVEQATAASHSLAGEAAELLRLLSQFQTSQTTQASAVTPPSHKPQAVQPAIKPRIQARAPVGKFVAIS
jgi:methyl-accepting chemotaxis protein